MAGGPSFELTDEQRELQALARKFAYEELRPVARMLDRETDPRAAYPRALVRRASELGLRTITLPRTDGGLDADALTQAIVLEELCAGDCGFGMLLVHPWREGRALATLTTPTQRAKYLPAFLQDPEYVTSLGLSEPHAGSDHVVPYAGDLSVGARTSAVLDGEMWVINGHKKWISNGHVSRMLLLLARTDATVPWTRGVSLFLVPTELPGFRAVGVEDKLGLRLNQNTELVFEDLRIPRDNLLGELNGGVEMLARLGCGSMLKEAVKSLGIARASYEEALAWTQRRVQGGRVIAEHPSVGAALVKMATDLESTRALIWLTAWAVDHAQDRVAALEGMVKVQAGEMAVRTAVSALELHGGYGVLREHHVEKLVRDAVSMLHAFGGNHAVRSRVAGALLSAPVDPIVLAARDHLKTEPVAIGGAGDD